MSMLYITFMGGPRFLLDGADVSDQISSKAAAIIALVLMRATRQMRRSDIISYLWSESSDDAAKYNLRFNLWQIKKALVQADGESLLLVSKDDIKVNPNFSFLCDISEIEQAALEDINSIAELKHLLSLFRGDFFENCSLHNCENFLEYIIQRRYYLENRKLVVYHRLIRRSAWRDAVQYYQMFYSRLLRDVGAEPSPELQELSKQFRLQKTRDVEENVLHLEVCTIPSLPGGWMSQVLKALCQSNQITWSDHLTQRQLSDLAYLQPILPAQMPTCVPMVRVAEAFIDLITGLCTGKQAYRLEIRSLNGAPLDALSRDVAEVLQKKCSHKLVIL